MAKPKIAVVQSYEFNAPQPAVPAPPSDDRMIAMFKALGYVLSARALLLLAVLGAFVLAIMAALHGTPATLYVLIAWCVLTIAPIVALEWRRRNE